MAPRAGTKKWEKWAEEQTRRYSEKIREEWSTIRDADVADQRPGFPLTDVFILLETAKGQPKGGFDPWGDERGAGETTVSLDEALKNKHVVLLGEPGAGKSTTLQYIGLKAAEGDTLGNSGSARQGALVPVMLERRDYQPKSAGDISISLLEALAGKVVDECSDLTHEESFDLVRYWTRERRLLVLMDGLDEAGERWELVREKIAQFATDPSLRDLRLVVTSRMAGYQALHGEFAEFTIKSLNEEAAKEFAAKWLQKFNVKWDRSHADQEAGKLVAHLSHQPALSRLRSNPLILKMTAAVYAHNLGDLPRNRARLYELYVDELWVRAKRRKVPEDQKFRVLACLRALAWHLQTGGLATENELCAALPKLSRGQVESPDRAAQIIQTASKMGLLDLGIESLKFHHPTFQEYLVSLRLLEAWKQSRSNTWTFLRTRLHLSEWREPILLLSAGLEEKDVDYLIRRVLHARSLQEDNLHRDLLLAVFMVVASNPAEREHVVGMLRHLRKFLHTKDYGLQEVLIEAMQELGEAALPDLRELLRDKNAQVREAAIIVLSDLGMAALPELQDALHDEYDIVWWIAVYGLGALGKAGLPKLREMLEAEDVALRRGAVKALGLLGAVALPDLRKAIYNEDAAVRWGAVDALREMVETALPADLDEALHDEDADELWNMVKTAQPDLHEALNDEDADVRWSASKVLMYLGETSLPELQEALRDGDDNLRSEVGGESIDEVVARRRWAVVELGKLGKAALPDLWEAVHDESHWVQSAAIKELAKLGEAALPDLLDLLHENNADSRQEAIKALAELGEKALPGLQKLFNDKNHSIRLAAASAMATIYSTAAIPNDQRERRQMLSHLRSLIKTRGLAYYLGYQVTSRINLIQATTSPDQDPFSKAKRSPAVSAALLALKVLGILAGLFLLTALQKIAGIIWDLIQKANAPILEPWVTAHLVQALLIVLGLAIVIACLDALFGDSLKELVKSRAAGPGAKKPD